MKHRQCAAATRVATAAADDETREPGWNIVTNDPTWVRVRSPSDDAGLSFQLEEGYQPPVWPTAPGQQQMMLHLDIAVEDLEPAVAWAIENGARLAEFQPQ